MQCEILKYFFRVGLHFVDKFCKVPGSIRLVVSPYLTSPPRRGGAFEAFIAPENFFPPLPHCFLLGCVACIRSSCDLRVGPQQNAQSGSLCGLLGNVIRKLFHERNYSFEHN
jgi:hypothetical protein